ncbi:MAG: SUMF1/EgtB/PvdO family nonheme iron enzyme [Methylotenera sp.]|nr:SUMF1/EgtB/PvdO family nonheme iron enzyme [Methylotenera sp.]MDO9388426.1 SUMF1/EgtB/PvdO family nonheme iron enzyme [Methylotenera sp.]
MSNKHLLRSMRSPTLLVQKPATDSNLYWDIPIAGLHSEHIKDAVNKLRSARQKTGEKISNPSYKIKDLLNNLVVSLGADSYEHWLLEIEPQLAEFMADHNLREPSNLIDWNNAPPRSALNARQIADRFFNSGRPLPKRLFTGVGNHMFAARGYGLLDLQYAASRLTNNVKFYSLSVSEQIKFASTHRNQIVIRADRLDDWTDDTPDYLDMTAQELVLNAFNWEVSTIFNLLGDSLVHPIVNPEEVQLYNANEEDLNERRELFKIFREVIDYSDSGWFDVIRFNGNLVFLKDASGRFDWVVKGQRNQPFSGNDLYPIFSSDELPKALGDKSIQTHLHYKKDIWLEQLKHLAEHHHYNNGGNLGNYPGENAIVERYLIATNKNFSRPKQKSAPRDYKFTPHAVSNKCLMVSNLVTIDEFLRFYHLEWAERREEKSKLTSHDWYSLPEMNIKDPVDLPVCVTWFDAIAYCKYLEKETGLPIRLLMIDEWREISPSRSAIEALGPIAKSHSVEAISVEGNVLASPTYLPHYFTRFKPDLCWVNNEQGLEFLSSLTFGEWLGDYRGSAPGNIHAPVACTASGIALGRGPLERELFEASYVGKNNHLKVGFRVCYLAELNS